MFAALLTLAAVAAPAIELARESEGSYYIRVVDGRDGTVAVYVDAAAAGLPAMLGTTTRSGNDTVFKPRYALEPGVRYRVEFTGAANATSVVEVPRPPHSPTVLRHVYPSAAELPENQLKFYLHFSAPMARGEIYAHVHLIDQDGREVEKPFLELGEELWDPSLTRFTLLFDPGRVKRDLVPNREVGAPLVAGRSYTFLVDQKLIDATGQRLFRPFRKEFSVVAADRTSLDPARWQIETARAGTTATISVIFPESLDHALLEHAIEVVRVDGRQVVGTVTTDTNERRWRFTPSEAWRAGSYTLVIATTLEDLAGNRIGRAFDVDTRATDANRKLPETVTLSFEIR